MERLHIYWADLFFGTLARISHHDRQLHLRLQLDLARFGLINTSEVISGKGIKRNEVISEKDRAVALLGRSSSAFSMHPTDDVLDRVRAFKKESPWLPPLKGKIRGGRLKPSPESILFAYYKELTQERQRPRLGRGDAAHIRAISAAAKKFGYTDQTFRKHLERAQRRYPEIALLLRRHGYQEVQSE